MVLTLHWEVGLGRTACEPGQVRKEAAAVSFVRVMCSASHPLKQPVPLRFA